MAPSCSRQAQIPLVENRSDLTLQRDTTGALTADRGFAATVGLASALCAA